MGRTPRPLGILFDLGDTLLSEHRYDLAKGLAALALPTGCDPATLTAEIDQVYRWSHREFRLASWLADRQPDLCRHDGIEQVERRVWECAVSLSPIPGVPETISYFAGVGLRMGCISNAIFSADLLAAELRRHDIDHVQFVHSSADLGFRKPDPRAFVPALDALQLEPHQVWFVGDTWEADVMGASSLGMFPVWLSNESPPDSEVECVQAGSWEELQSLVVSAL
ncbi:MAG: HAD family hydrolase [Planctomycetota bacterium]